MRRSAQAIVDAIVLRGQQDAKRSPVLVGLLGRGIGPSRSPFMHEAEGRRLGLDYIYALIDFDTEDLADSDFVEVLRVCQAAGFAGVNITHPFKQRAIVYTAGLSPEAAAIGAVNTIVFAEGKREGHNTDSWGFSQSFREGLPGAALDSVLLLGAGGGGAAVAHALLGLGLKRLILFDVDSARAEILANRLAPRFDRMIDVTTEPDSRALSVDGVVNASPVGMRKYPGVPLPIDRLAPCQWVADIVYFPAETEFLRRARAQGCAILGGTGMAICQAAKAFELFTGIAPDLTSMARHFEAAA
jgi:shikimate dehydrogenase